ncbi:lipopolysaccharide biosynthesis protein [Stenotrophomonas humi]|nr:hypothetical protein [Stenotrophomonas humi]
MSMLVARNSSLEEFAQFSLFYAFIVLLNFIHAPLINDSLVVRAASGRRASLSATLTTTALLFSPLSILGVCVLAVTGVVDVVDAIFLLIPAAVLSSLYWSARSALHSTGNHRGAFATSSLGTLFLLIALIGLLRVGVEPFRAALISMAIAALGGVGAAVCHGTVPAGASSSEAKVAQRVAPALLVAGLVWLAGNASMLFLGHFGRLDDIAGLRSVLTLLLPVNQVLIGLSAFLLPRFARLHQSDDPVGTKRLLARLLVACVVLAVLFSLLVYPLAGYLLELIYGTEYRRFEGWMRLGAMALPLCWAVITLCRTYFRGTGELHGLLLINATGLLVGLPLSLLCLLSLGDNAVMMSFVVIQVAMMSTYLLVGSARRAA